MRKILLLGGSAQQLVAIEKAKELGYYTVLCDYLLDNPGQYVADKYYPVSTTDCESLYSIAKNEQVEGILAYASDPAALPAAIVAEKLNLPTNPVESVKILGLKHHWRNFLKDNNFACPQHFQFESNILIEELVKEIEEFSFPLVVKPTDSSGSKGVSIIKEIEELNKAISYAKSYSRNNELIIEEYIERSFPSVIGGDIFVWEGKIVLYGLMECLRDLTNSPLIPIGEKKPLLVSEDEECQIKSELQRVITTLGIRFGELNVEILLDKNHKVHFLELGPRAGGNMIPIQLSDAYGIDLVEANVKAAMGEVPSFLNNALSVKSGCYMHYVLHSYNYGNFRGVSIDKSIEDKVYRKVIYKKDGDKIEYFDGAGKAIGIIFLHFNNVDEMEFFCRNHNSLVKIELK